MNVRIVYNSRYACVVPDFLRIIGELIQRYGDCFRVWLGTQLVIVMGDPKDIEVGVGKVLALPGPVAASV